MSFGNKCARRLRICIPYAKLTSSNLQKSKHRSCRMIWLISFSRVPLHGRRRQCSSSVRRMRRRAMEEVLQQKAYGTTDPHAVSAGVSTGALGDPSLARMGAIMQHGNIEVQTGHKLISLCESKFISQVLPFVIPCMVSGPDYSFHDKTNRWRRRDDPRWAVAPLVSASKFTVAFARRCESQCRQDWNALPSIRSVNFRYAVETLSLIHI